LEQNAIDINAGGYYVHDSVRYESVDEFYSIAGFSDTWVVFYKSKEIFSYNCRIVQRAYLVQCNVFLSVLLQLWRQS